MAEETKKSKGSSKSAKEAQELVGIFAELAKSMESFSQQSSASLSMIDESMKKFSDTGKETLEQFKERSLQAAKNLEELSSSSTSSSQGIGKLTDSMKDLAKSEEKASKEAGFKKGGDGKNNIFEQMGKSSKVAKLGVIALSGAFSLLGKAIKGITSIVGTVFDLIGSGLGMIKSFIGGIIDFIGDTFSALAEQSNTMKDRMFEQAVALEKVKETFGDTSKGAGKAMRDFTATAVGMYSPTALRQIFGSVAEAGDYALNLLNAGAESSILLRDQIKENAKEIIVFSKAIGQTADEFEAMKLNAIATGQGVMEMQKDIIKYSQGFAKRLGLDAKLLAKNVSIAQKDVKHFANVTIKEMTQAAAYANKLGLSLEKITGIMDAFDTFENAANNVSKLSQAFGVNLDTMKLLEANTPDEQLAQIKDAFNAAGKSAANMNRHELSLIASMVHLDEASVKAALSAENQGASLEDIKDAGSTMEKQMLSTSEAMKTSMDEIAMSLKKLERNSTGFFDAFLDGLAEGVIESGPMKGLLANLAQALDTVFLMGRKLGDIIVNTFPGIKDMLAGLAGFFDPKKIGDMFGGFNRVFEKFFKNLKNGTGNVKDLFGDLFNEIKSYFSSQGSNGQKFLSGASDFWNAIKQIIATAILGIGELIADGLSFIADLLEGKKTLNTGGLASAAGKGVDKLKKEFSPIGDAFAKSFEKIGPQFDRIFNEIGKRLDVWWEKTKKQISDWWENFDLLGAIMNNPGTATVLGLLIGGKAIGAGMQFANLAVNLTSALTKGIAGAQGAAASLAKTLSSGGALFAAATAAAAAIAAAVDQAKSFYQENKSWIDSLKRGGGGDENDPEIKKQKSRNAVEEAKRAKDFAERKERISAGLGEQAVPEQSYLKSIAGMALESPLEVIGGGALALASAIPTFGTSIAAYTVKMTDKSEKEFVKARAEAADNRDYQINELLKLAGNEDEFRQVLILQENSLKNLTKDFGTAELGRLESFKTLAKSGQTFTVEDLQEGVEIDGKKVSFSDPKVIEAILETQKLEQNKKLSLEKVQKFKEEESAAAAAISEEAGKKMMEESMNELGLTTVDNVEERIKKIQEIGAKVAGGKEEFNKNMETLRKNLSEMNFSLFDKPEDRDKFAKMLGDSTAFLTLVGTMDKVFAGMQAFGEKAAGLGTAADPRSIIGKLFSGLISLQKGMADVRAMFGGGKLSIGVETEGFSNAGIKEDTASSIDSTSAQLYKVSESIETLSKSLALLLIPQTTSLAENLGKFSKSVDVNFFSNLQALGVLMGGPNSEYEGMSLIEMLGTPADLTSTTDAITKWTNQASKMFEMLGASLKKMDEKLGSVEAIKSKIQSISELRQQLDNAMQSLQTEQNVTVPYAPEMGKQVTAAQPTPSRITSGGTQITLKFDIVMDSKSLEKTLVTRSDSIVVKALTGLAEGTNKIIGAIPGNEISVTKKAAE